MYGQFTFILRGINATNLIAGRIEMCVNSEWRALCHDGWDSDDTIIACGILGFSQCKLILAIILGHAYNNQITALHCGNSCFGKSSLPRGIRHIWCDGLLCGWDADISACEQDAGLVCSEFGYAEGREHGVSVIID